MKKLSMFLMLVVALVAFASCGGNASKKNEAQQTEVKEAALPVGLQLYTVRGDMEKDFKGTLQKVKELGYDGVEFAGLFGNAPADVKAMCAEIGLNPISAHVPLADMLADVDKVIADYKAIGCEYIVVPYVTEERRPGGDKFMQMVEEIRTIGQKCKEAGLVLLYHNHDFEFKQISTSCDNFNITGSMAYNKDKTSLYISSIEFCGSDDNAIYESVECKLYESFNDWCRWRSHCYCI